MRSPDVSNVAEDAGCEWRKSLRSYGSGQCVEVAAPSKNRIDVRDSKNAHGAILTFSPAQWNEFVAFVRSDGFD